MVSSEECLHFFIPAIFRRASVRLSSVNFRTAFNTFCVFGFSTTLLVIRFCGRNQYIVTFIIRIVILMRCTIFKPTNIIRSLSMLHNSHTRLIHYPYLTRIRYVRSVMLFRNRLDHIISSKFKYNENYAAAYLKHWFRQLVVQYHMRKIPKSEFRQIFHAKIAQRKRSLPEHEVT